MAVPISSRYRGSEVYPAADAAGEPRATVAIRRYEPPPADAVDYQHRVSGAEDVEYLSWRFYGDSESWWRIADANPVAFPLDLAPGDTVGVPTGDRPAQISRERVF
jgi:hypothetical protein